MDVPYTLDIPWICVVGHTLDMPYNGQTLAVAVSTQYNFYQTHYYLKINTHVCIL